VLRRPVESALGAGVGVVHEILDVLPGAGAGVQGHLQGGQRQFGQVVVGDRPPDDPARAHVQHEGGVGLAGVGVQVGEVDHPQPVRGGRGEVTVHPVRGPLVGRVGAGRLDEGVPAAHADQAQVAHQPLDRAAGHRTAIDLDVHPMHELPHPAGPGQLPAGVGVVPDLRQQLLDLLIPQVTGTGRTGLGRVVRARGDLAHELREHAADRLDPEPFLDRIDERDHDLGGQLGPQRGHHQRRLPSPAQGIVRRPGIDAGSVIEFR
jgi:hypothetical protein